MLDVLYQYASDAAADAGIGACIWLLALRFPFRSLPGQPELGWDLAAFFGSLAFALAIMIGLEEPFLDWTIAEIGAWHEQFGTMLWWAALPLYVVASDFGAYWAHRLLHTPALWDAHAWHHSPRHLWFLAGTRAAPLHILVLTTPYTLAYIAFPYSAAGLAALAHAGFQVANQHYIHSNLRLPWAKKLEYVLVTPRYHFVHHSRARERSDSNYGFIFSVWDRLFGTLTDPASVAADEPLGLDSEIRPLRAFLGLPRKRGAHPAGGSADPNETLQERAP